MDIGGVDLPSLYVPTGRFDPRAVLSALIDGWPDAIFQDADEEETHSVAALLATDKRIPSKEFFVYRDLANAEDWSANGETPTNQNEMVHFVTRKAKDRKGRIEITMVAGDLTRETMLFYNRVAEALEASLAKLTTLEAELHAAGSGLSRKDFYALVDEARTSLYPEWSEDDLVCHPRDSLQFCEVVRTRVGAPVPDHLILKALLNRQKLGRTGTL